MKGAITLLLAVALALGCAPAPTPALVTPPDHPKRVVSIDYCADQFVLKLADRAQIAAVSADARKEFSYMRAAAAEVRHVRPSAEDVLALAPDLVVRAYGGGPQAQALFHRAGVPVVQLNFANDFNGVRATIRQIGVALGHPARAEALIADMDARLAAARHGAIPETALYVTPGGVTTGEGSLVHAMITAAGLENFETQPGWRSLPLERLAAERPDMVAAAFFNQRANQQDVWSAARHPLTVALLRDRPRADLEGAWMACGGWFVVEGVERMAATRRAAQGQP